MKFKVFYLLISIIFPNLIFGQTLTLAPVIYSAGDIPTSFNAYDPTCNGAATPLTAVLPAGGPWIVTSVDVEYDMTALATGDGYVSEQRSRLACQNTAVNEGAFINGSAIWGPGTDTYNRAGLTIANGQYNGGTNLIFELQAYRTWDGNGPGCDVLDNIVDDNTWKITVYYELAVPMAYTSSTTSHSTVSNIENCATSANLLKIEIETTGIITPLNVAVFNLSTVGTTNLGEVNAINVYYTGNSNGFSTGNLFGTVASGGSVSVTGSQNLVEGMNYFWVEYALTPILSNGNTFDCACTTIDIQSNLEIPTETAPNGLRLVSVCAPAPGGVSNDQVWLTSESGVSGASPVTGWTNQGDNTNLTTFSGGVGSQLNVAEPYLNFHDGIKLGGGYDGGFHHSVTNRTDLISGNEITMFVVTDGGQDLTLSYHSLSSSNNQWEAFAFRHAGLGAIYSGGAVSNTYNAGFTMGNMNIYGMRGTSNAAAENTCNGFKSNVANAGTFTSSATSFEVAVGWWPGWANTNSYTEAIIWEKELTAIEFHIVETYLAIKYGVTLGVNGTSMDYNSALNTVIWDATANNGYAFDIAGISRDDAAGLDQRKSHSVNGTSTTTFNDILTVANGTDFSNPQLMTDQASFVWGHNNGPTLNTGAIVNYPTDNGETIQTIFQRHWKGQETGTVSNVILEFDLSLVMGTNVTLGGNDLANLRLLVDEDGDFSNGATAYSPTSFDNTTNIAYFQTDFTPQVGGDLTPDNGFFFTLGSTNFSTTPLPVQLISFSGECDKSLIWQTMSEINNDYFVIEKSSDGLNWYQVAKINGNGTTSSLNEYHFTDTESNGYMTYYRLEQTDFDGTTTIVGQTKVECENNKPIIYPNPFNDELFINFKTEGKYFVVVRDVLGRIIFSKEFIEINSSIQYLDLNQILPKGMYYVSILQNEKTILLNEKIVKN